MKPIHVCLGCGRRDTSHASQLCYACLGQGRRQPAHPARKGEAQHQPLEDRYDEESGPDDVVVDSPEMANGLSSWW